jgi:hypothetical protein
MFAVNCCVAPAATVAEVGDIVSVVVPVIVTVAESDFVLSACDVAVTVALADVGMVAGAVYSPLLLTLPGPETVQVTAVFELPWTVAVNCCVAPRATVAVLGETATVTTGTVMVIVAISDFVVSSFEVAVMVTVAGFGTVRGAVYVAVQPTLLSPP